MKLTQWIVCAAVLISTNTYSFEWDAKQLEASIGARWAFYNTDGYPAGPLFNVSAGGSVPILVEQHSRLATLASVSYAPIYGQDTDEIGGNFSAINLQILLEHDLVLGARRAWAGIGVQGSLAYSFSQFKVLESGYSELIDSSFSTTAAVIGRFEIPLNTVYSVSLNAQFSPLADSYSGVGVAAIMHF